MLNDKEVMQFIEKARTSSSSYDTKQFYINSSTDIDCSCIIFFIFIIVFASCILGILFHCGVCESISHALKRSNCTTEPLSA